MGGLGVEKVLKVKLPQWENLMGKGILFLFLLKSFGDAPPGVYNQIIKKKKEIIFNDRLDVSI